jgi:hypothetical protein
MQWNTGPGFFFIIHTPKKKVWFWFRTSVIIAITQVSYKALKFSARLRTVVVACDMRLCRCCCGVEAAPGCREEGKEMGGV